MIALLLTAAWGAAGQPSKSCVVPGQFKGVELYSWRLDQGKWAFAIVPGTNREKTENEIKQNQRCIHDLNDVKRELSNLGRGDEVFWLRRPGFEIPSDDIVKLVEASAARVGAKVHVLSKGQR